MSLQLHLHMIFAALLTGIAQIWRGCARYHSEGLFFERTTTGATRVATTRPANYNQEGSRRSRRSCTIATGWGEKHNTADCTLCPGYSYRPGCISRYCSSPSAVNHIAERVYQLVTDHDDGTSETETSHVQVVRYKTAPSRGRYSAYSNSAPKKRSRIFHECSICGENNHTRKFCPRRDPCYRCLKPGHYARDCRANQPSRPFFGKGRVMALAVEKHGLLRVDVQLGGPGYHPFLVDTGAETNLISASLTFNIKGKINRQLFRQPVMVVRSSIRCEGTVTCRIRLGPRDISAQFYIVPGITEGILRLDTLSHLDLQIDPRT